MGARLRFDDRSLSTARAAAPTCQQLARRTRATMKTCFATLLLALVVASTTLACTQATRSDDWLHQHFPFTFAVTGPIGLFVDVTAPCSVEVDVLRPGGWLPISRSSLLLHNELWDTELDEDYRVRLIECDAVIPTPAALYFTTRARKHVRRVVVIGQFTLSPVDPAWQRHSPNEPAHTASKWRPTARLVLAVLAYLGAHFVDTMRPQYMSSRSRGWCRTPHLLAAKRSRARPASPPATSTAAVGFGDGDDGRPCYGKAGEESTCK